MLNAATPFQHSNYKPSPYVGERGNHFPLLFRVLHSRKSGKCTDAARVRPGIKSAGLYSSCTKKWRCFHMGNPNFLP